MLIVLVVALLANTTSQTPTIAELAKLHRHAMGPMPASTARWTGSITRGVVVQPFTVNADSTGRYRGSWQTALGLTLVGSDGKVDWTQDESGAVESQPSTHGFALGYELARLDAYDFSDKNATVSGPSALDNRQVYALKIADADNPMTLYIDAKTYLVDGADAPDSTIRYRAHKRFNGFEVPTQIDDTSGAQTTSRKIDSVTFGVDDRRRASRVDQHVNGLAVDRHGDEDERVRIVEADRDVGRSLRKRRFARSWRREQTRHVDAERDAVDLARGRLIA